MEKAAVTAVCWVPRGKISMKSPEAMVDEDSCGDAHDNADTAAAIAHAAATAKAVTDGLEEFDLDNYDEDDDEEGMHLFSVLNNDLQPGMKDPLMIGDPDSESEDDFDDDIKPEDRVFIATSCEEDSQQLEVYIYVEEEGSMYVHHDVMLTAYPLCIEYLDQAGPGLQGCYGAVGLIDNSIQIWDLEDPDPVEPASSLGVAMRKKGKTKKKRAIPTTLGNQAHDGAVMCLHGSVFNRNVLASGSADETLKVWDVTENKCIHTYSHHGDKVQTVRWHPTEKAVLCSAGFDGRLALMDVRQPGQAVMTDLPAEAESVMWSRHNAFECLASVDNGGVVCYDVRKVVSKADEGQRLWTLMAHDVACTALTDAPTKNLLMTVGLCGQAKVWNLADGKPSLVMSKDLKAGPLFACQSNAEDPALMCFGGHCPVMWDLTSESLLADVFGFPCEDAGLE